MIVIALCAFLEIIPESFYYKVFKNNPVNLQKILVDGSPVLRDEKMLDFYMLNGLRFDEGINNRLTVGMVGYNVNISVEARYGNEHSYPYHKFKGLIASDYKRAYLGFNAKGMKFIIGRERFKWSEGLMLGNAYHHLDGIYVLKDNKNYVFSFLFSKLSSDMDTNRYISAHRFMVKRHNFAFGLQESVVYGGYKEFPDIYYLNPLVLYYPKLWNDRETNENVLWSFPFVVKYSNNIVSWEFLIDDFPYDQDSKARGEHPKLGFSASLYMFRNNLSMKFNARALTRWVYTHKTSYLVYQNDSTCMGNGDGADLASISSDFFMRISHNTWLDFYLKYMIKGEGNIFDREPLHFPNEYFLSPPLKRDMDIKLSLYRNILLNHIICFKIFYEYNRIGVEVDLELWNKSLFHRRMSEI